MEIYVVSRTTNNSRILETATLDKDGAETARQAVIKRYEGAPHLCTDTETERLDVFDVWVATKVKATKDGTAPITTVLAVGSKTRCRKEAALVVEALESFVNGDVTGDVEHGWTATDADTDTIYTVELHKA